MKQTARKLLSLLMAFAIIVSMAPVALAAGEVTITGGPENGEITAGANVFVTLRANVTSPVDGTTYTYTWSIDGATKTGQSVQIPCTTAGTISASVTVTCPNASDPSGTPTTVGEATTSFEVKAAQPSTPLATSIVITPPSVELTLGSNKTSQVLSAEVKGDAGVSQDVTWSIKSGSESISLSGATVTAVKEGNAVVTATSVAKNADGNSVTQDVSIVVKPAAVAATTITFNPTSLSLSAGGAAGTVVATVKQGTTPVVGQTVTVAVGDTAPVTGVITSATGATTVTDENGQIRISVTPGSVAGGGTVSVTCNGVSQNFQVTVGSGYTATLTGNPATSSVVYLDNWSANNNANYHNFYVTPALSIGGVTQVLGTNYTVEYNWTLNGYSVQTNGASTTPNTYTLLSSNNYLHYGTSNNTLKCTATFTILGQTTFTRDCTWTINTGYDNYLVSATVYSGSSGYGLGEYDDEGRSSIVDQLESLFRNSTTYYTSYGLKSVRFLSTGTTSGGRLDGVTSTNTEYYPNSSPYLSNVSFVPGTSSNTTVTFPIRVTYYTNSSYTNTAYVDGNIRFNISGTSSAGDITYSAGLGDTVSFDVRDFEDFWTSSYSRGTLDRVRFNSVSSGTLRSSGGSTVTTSTDCHVSPTSRETGLDGVYFTPSSSMKRATTIRIGFTAYGSNNYSSSSTSYSKSGTVTIIYLNGNAKDITYSTVNGSVSLKASDFTNAYREAVGSSAPSGMTIVFQNVPSYGTLTYKNGSRDTTLTNSNVKSRNFTTRTTGSNRLEDVTYSISGSTPRSDTIDYIAYSGSTPQFTGKVVFNSVTTVSNLLVALSCPNPNTGVAFSTSQFNLANATVMANASMLQFGIPGNGTLTYNGAALSATNSVPYGSLGAVVYKPNASLASVGGTDSVTFTVYNTSGVSIGSGRVSIVVTRSTTAVTNPTNISQFTDVPKDGSASWYTTALSSLLSQGVVSGKGNGKFGPTDNLKYGEALKMVLNAAKYTATEVGGDNWAINYKALAVNNGWISNDIVLTDYISRDAVVELTARVLGLPASSAASPFKDSTNGYAVALYYTTPQIITGTQRSSGLYFYGSQTLQRAEAACIVYRMMDYYSRTHVSTTVPDGI